MKRQKLIKVLRLCPYSESFAEPIETFGKVKTNEARQIVLKMSINWANEIDLSAVDEYSIEQFGSGSQPSVKYAIRD